MLQSETAIRNSTILRGQVALVVCVLAELNVEALHEGVIGGFADHTGFIKKGNETDGFLLNQVANGLVIEVFHGLPFDSFADVLLLLALECQLNEQLLELLIAIAILIKEEKKEKNIARYLMFNCSKEFFSKISNP